MKCKRSVKHRTNFLYEFLWGFKHNKGCGEAETPVIARIDSKTSIFFTLPRHQLLTVVLRKNNAVLLLLPIEEVFQ
jgi:hypothetical protein